MEKEKLNYGNLLTISKNLCKTFYVSNERMFGPTVKTRDDEKNVIYSILKFSLDNNLYDFDLIELKQAVNISVDEANIKRYSSNPPPHF